MEGLSTKISKKKALSRKQPQWILLMKIGEGSTLIPKVTLCTENTCREMTIVATTPTNMTITFQVYGFLFFCVIVGLKIKLHYQIRIKFLNKIWIAVGFKLGLSCSRKWELI